jgi:hypothetical protein
MNTELPLPCPERLTCCGFPVAPNSYSLKSSPAVSLLVILYLTIPFA